MKKLKAEHIEVYDTVINITFIDEEGLIYHYNIAKDELIPCDESCNFGDIKKGYKNEHI